MEHIRRSSKDRKELLSVMNFARNFIDDLLLPWGVERIIYMDADTIVQVRAAAPTGAAATARASLKRRRTTYLPPCIGRVCRASRRVQPQRVAGRARRRCRREPPRAPC